MSCIRSLVPILSLFSIRPKLVCIQLEASEASAISRCCFGCAGRLLTFNLLHLQNTGCHIWMQMSFVGLLLNKLILSLMRHDITLAHASHRFIAISIQDSRVLRHEYGSFCEIQWLTDWVASTLIHLQIRSEFTKLHRLPAVSSRVQLILIIYTQSVSLIVCVRTLLHKLLVLGLIDELTAKSWNGWLTYVLGVLLNLHGRPIFIICLKLTHTVLHLIIQHFLTWRYEVYWYVHIRLVLFLWIAMTHFLTT